jgi:hypothetical protein
MRVVMNEMQGQEVLKTFDKWLYARSHEAWEVEENTYSKIEALVQQ